MDIARGRGRYYFRYCLLAIGFLLLVALPGSSQSAQDPPAPAVSQQPADGAPPTQAPVPDPNDPAAKDTGKTKSDRMFFVMPNFFTVDDESQRGPISWKQKFVITAKGSFDPYEFAVVGILAGTRQAENAYPGFGQGFEGYGKRYGAALADQVDGNLMVGAVFPTILKTDPRYFRLGTGKFIYRFGYAMSRIFITRRDSGGRLFNIPEFAGNATAIAISNVYYPPADRGFSASANNWGVQMGIDALGNELKEFWPDIHRRLTKTKKSSPGAVGGTPD
jgi:hypothetical protein